MHNEYIGTKENKSQTPIFQPVQSPFQNQHFTNPYQTNINTQRFNSGPQIPVFSHNGQFNSVQGPQISPQLGG